jgi:hypothetical protein
MHCCTLGLSRSYEGETASILIHVPSMIPQTQDQDSNIKNHDSISQLQGNQKDERIRNTPQPFLLSQQQGHPLGLCRRT